MTARASDMEAFVVYAALLPYTVPAAEDHEPADAPDGPEAFLAYLTTVTR
jgi:hypothetical protein